MTDLSSLADTLTNKEKIEILLAEFDKRLKKEADSARSSAFGFSYKSDGTGYANECWNTYREMLAQKKALFDRIAKDLDVTDIVCDWD